MKMDVRSKLGYSLTMAKGLNPKQKLFVAEYLVDRNATQAAIRAGYTVRSAQQVGSRLMLNVVIADGIKAGLAKIEDKVMSVAVTVRKTKEEWLAEIEALAFSNTTDMFAKDANGKLKMSISDIKERGLGRLIRKIKVDQSGKVEIDLHSKQHALDLLARANHWISDQLDVNLNPQELTGTDYDKLMKDPETAAAIRKIAQATSKHKPKETT